MPQGYTLIALGDFNETTGTDKDGYESCVGRHGSGSKDESYSMLLAFVKCLRLKKDGSWYQRLDLKRSTWYSNGRDARKRIDHVLLGSLWEFVQNCRIFQIAEFNCSVEWLHTTAQVP